MPRQLAILVFTLFVIWLWRGDAKSRPKMSKPLWIPFVWLLSLGSHPLSWWLAFFFGIGSTGGSNLEGNPINRAFYAILILSAIVIVVRRWFLLDGAHPTKRPSQRLLLLSGTHGNLGSLPCAHHEALD